MMGAAISAPMMMMAIGCVCVMACAWHFAAPLIAAG